MGAQAAEGVLGLRKAESVVKAVVQVSEAGQALAEPIGEGERGRRP